MMDDDEEWVKNHVEPEAWEKDYEEYHRKHSTGWRGCLGITLLLLSCFYYLIQDYFRHLLCLIRGHVPDGLTIRFTADDQIAFLACQRCRSEITPLDYDAF